MALVRMSWASDIQPDLLIAGQKSRPPQIEVDEAPAIERAIARTEVVPSLVVLRPFAAGAKGLRIKVGRAIPTSGFALGPEFVRRDLALGRVMVRASARASMNRYLHIDAEFALPRLAGDHAFVNLLATHRNYPQLLYFGQGQNSDVHNISNYRLEDTSAEFTAGLRAFDVLRIGATAGYVKVNVGPGTSDLRPSTYQNFTSTNTPGLHQQPNFATGGGFVEVDYSDLPGSPSSGGIYSARFNNFVDQWLGAYSFRRLDVDLRQYLPFFSKQRVIALRAYTALTDSTTGRSIPFYLQPTLGGPDTLRGFRPFRFYDNNMMFFNGEYRFKVSSGLMAVLFAEGGKVFHRRGDFHFRDLQASYGGGLRTNLRGNVFMRVEVGCSHEGCQGWLRFNNMF
jgi:outer membrane protein assembly factor BamA